MASSPTSKPGLRERKKLATRRALQRAALDLALAHGPDVTVEEICEAADVSPRTFFNYFSSKEEAIVGEPPAFPTDELLAEYEAGGPTGDAIDDLRAVLGPHLRDNLPSVEQLRLRKQMLDTHPELVPHFMRGFWLIEQRLTEATAERLGQTVEDLDPQLVAAVAATCMRTAVRRWIHTGATEPVDVHVDRVFEAVARTLRDL